MKQDHRDDRNKLGNSVRSRKKRDVFQAIDNRHSEDCRRERFPEIGDISGCFSDEKKERSNYNKRTEKENFGQGGILPCEKKRFCGNRDEPFRSMRGRMSACAGEAAPVFLPPCARLGSAVRSFYAKKPIFWAERRCGHFCERAVRLCKNTSTRAHEHTGTHAKSIRE